MTAAAIAPVEPLRMPLMGLSQRFGSESARPGRATRWTWFDIRHRTSILAPTFLAQGVEIAPAILVEQENVLAVVAFRNVRIDGD